MRTRLIRIGNSRGVLLPESLIAQAGLGDEVELQVRDGAIILEPATGSAGGAEQMPETDDDLLLDFPASTHFDEKEWEW
ncbi:MAG: AbrB/MazE/SpoVT family DNA-binding domain-containing protein [Desulfomonile tiedjei]|nr:AbrB/MazE/SpoVT family DNA-binding domain-containing protein [Desulfomonile tiedjei]